MSDASGNNIAPMPKRSHHGKLSAVTSLQDAFDHPDFKSRIMQAVPKHLSPDRMLAVFVQAVQKTPKLRECNIMSLLGAFLSVASVGLEPNTALQHAHLIPFAKRQKNPQTGKWEDGRVDVQVIFGYQGLLELAYRSGLLVSVSANVVWRSDEFDFWYGSGAQLRHKPLGGLRGENEMPDWAYMHANMKAGGEAFEVMPISDVIAIRDASQGYQAAKRARDAWNGQGKPPASYTEAPWVRNFVPMARKTAFRAGSKWLPKSIELAAAIALDELQDRKTANFAGVIDGSASVLDGGLDALSDESEQRDDAPFAGYSQQADRAPAAAASETAPTQAPAGAATAPPRQASPPPPPPSVPAFQQYVVDDGGEVADDAYVDPVLWAEALGAVLRASSNRAQVLENNAEAIAEARGFPAAAEVLADLLRSSEADTGPAAAIPVERGRTGPDLKGWVKTAKAAILHLGADEVARWVENNEPVYRPFPASFRLEVTKALAARCGALGIAVVGQPAAHAAAAQGGLGLPLEEAQSISTPPPVGQFEISDATADAMVARVGGLGSEGDVHALAGEIMPSMNAAREAAPRAWKKVSDAFTARLSVLRAPPPAVDERPAAEVGDPGPTP